MWRKLRKLEKLRRLCETVGVGQSVPFRLRAANLLQDPVERFRRIPRTIAARHSVERAFCSSGLSCQTIHAAKTLFSDISFQNFETVSLKSTRRFFMRM